jgi:predicted HAD superfamily Cof-like phosphohydrolase
MEKSFVENVVEFNQKILKIKQRPIGKLSDAEFDISAQSLAEELVEFEEAETVIDQIDALIDLQYFAIGIMYKLGMRADQINDCMLAVHEANMTKKKGVNKKRGNGKVADAVKPKGWVKPEDRIREILGVK